MIILWFSKKKRRFASECLKVIKDEVSKLLKASVIKESHYLDWLANVVIAPKKEKKWRVCVDFTDLKKSSLKTTFLS